MFTQMIEKDFPNIAICIFVEATFAKTQHKQVSRTNDAFKHKKL